MQSEGCMDRLTFPFTRGMEMRAKLRAREASHQFGAKEASQAGAQARKREEGKSATVVSAGWLELLSRAERRIQTPDDGWSVRLEWLFWCYCCCCR